MPLINGSMQGLVLLSLTGDADMPLDFALKGSGGVLFTRADWWLTEWQMGSHVFTLPDVPVRDSVDGAERITWGNGMSLSFSTVLPSQWQASVIQNVRDAMDVRRAEYLAALQSLIDATDPAQFSFDAWIAAVQARPTVTPTELYRRKNAPLRNLAGILCRDGDNNVIDALVVDELGNAATVGNTRMLGALASEWMTRDTRPELSEWLNWVSGLTPYEPYWHLERPTLFQQDGLVAEVADAFVAKFR